MQRKDSPVVFAVGDSGVPIMYLGFPDIDLQVLVQTTVACGIRPSSFYRRCAQEAAVYGRIT
jgi:hypothetical protein